MNIEFILSLLIAHSPSLASDADQHSAALTSPKISTITIMIRILPEVAPSSGASADVTSYFTVSFIVLMHSPSDIAM